MFCSTLQFIICQ